MNLMTCKLDGRWDKEAMRKVYNFSKRLHEIPRNASTASLMRCILYLPALIIAILCGNPSLRAQHNPFVIESDQSTVVLEPYAPNIIRVTISQVKDKATAPPGYGVIGVPSDSGWEKLQDTQGDDVYKSMRLIVTVDKHSTIPSAPTEIYQQLRLKFLGERNPSGPRVKIATPDGRVLLDMQSSSMKRVPSTDSSVRPPSTEPKYRVTATFASPENEHYYGLGQYQQGFLDLRGHIIDCWHNYADPYGEDVCVPFLLSTGGYGLIWDNPSKTTVSLGIHEQNIWSSQEGDRISFFLIAGKNSDDIYSGYRQLTGTTQMLPKPVYGFIQSKAVYPTQAEILRVADEYRQRKYPVDVMTVDYLYYTKMGEMDMDPEHWPDPEAMNRELHASGFKSLLSIWPHFAEGSRYYDMLLNRGWLIRPANGNLPPVWDYLPKAGPDIDITNPEAAHWFWDIIRDNFVKKGFDYIWLDETEPDVDPAGNYFFIGSGDRYYNVYPLFETSAVYDGFRKDYGDSRRVMLLARAAYLGAQRNGTIFWSSDIYSTWDVLKRQIPAGLNFAAAGMAYWCDDIGGFREFPKTHHPLHPPLLNPSDARGNVGDNDDYPELYVRWFEYGVFQPIFRTHGVRKDNEVWTYGKQAEPILAKYLRLRYQLLPYIYSLGYATSQTGAPYMRALFMDFSEDPKVTGISDEYMFGPAFLVAPITDQGATSRDVYLPAGTDWYNYWTNERITGGQTIKVDAPIETIPLFVKAGSIVPQGSAIESAQDMQRIEHVLVYPGANGDFTLYNDDGLSYRYEKGNSELTHLHWDDSAQKLTQNGSKAWSGDAPLIVVNQ